MSNTQVIRLSEYLGAIQSVIKMGFGDDGMWVKAEIVSMNSKGGHYYFELAEKDQFTDKTIATCRGTLWKGQAARIITQFKAESGIELSKDLKVLVKVKATFSPQYSFSLNIESIDSSFTSGDLAQKYQDIIQRLTTEELIDLNRTLPTPFDIEQVLVIAPENAAGLGDFQKDADQLAAHKVCQFTYAHATFQGLTAADSIQKTLNKALKAWAKQHEKLPDIIVMIRGGGAVNDLAYLNDYELAATLSQVNIPIWVGIGHERDRTILDEIANRSFDTPSKVIAGIKHHIANVTSQAQEYFDQIYSTAHYEFNAIQADIEAYITDVKSTSKFQLAQLDYQLDQLMHEHKHLSQRHIDQVQQQAEQLMREILLQSPRQTLDRGYAIVRLNGKVATSPKQIEGKHVQIELKDGLISAQIENAIAK